MRLFAHHDADGLSSAVMFLLTHGDETIDTILPNVFGDYGDSSSEDDWMVDMKPVDSNFKGTCADHHPDHPVIEDRSYKLYHSDLFPASRVVYNLFKDQLEEMNMDWLVALGCVGDGQPEKIPSDVWRRYPQLRENISEKIYVSYGNMKLSPYPLYTRISSPVNAMNRMGTPELALEIILKDIKAPEDIVLNSKLLAAKKKVATEHERVLKNLYIIEHSNIILAIYSSAFKLSGWIGTELEAAFKKTIIAVNTQDDSMSIRGVLATLIAEELQKRDFVVGGHHGYAGGTCHDVDVLTEIVRTI